MSEEKANYIIVSEYMQVCILKDGFETTAIRIAKAMKEICKNGHPKIFRITEEIYWQDEGNEDLAEKIIISNIREFGGEALDY